LAALMTATIFATEQAGRGATSAAFKQPPLNGDRLPYQVILARVIRPARETTMFFPHFVGDACSQQPHEFGDPFTNAPE
jgi:hypothetical protein